MEVKSILKDVMQLTPAERLYLLELIAKSLSKPNSEIEKIWAVEAEKRYQALKNGKVKTYTIQEITERYK
ncbi:MAG: addiction module protein [Ignavibacteriales bacterium]|nr:addiction module protein [Ignavibacteriales bacterium]